MSGTPTKRPMGRTGDGVVVLARAAAGALVLAWGVWASIGGGGGAIDDDEAAAVVAAVEGLCKVSEKISEGRA